MCSQIPGEVSSHAIPEEPPFQHQPQQQQKQLQLPLLKPADADISLPSAKSVKGAKKLSVRRRAANAQRKQLVENKVQQSVTKDGANQEAPAKRKRMSVACLGCRARKVKVSSFYYLVTFCF